MKDQESNVLIVQTSFSGHRLWYIRLLIERCNELGIGIWVHLPDSAKDSIEMSVHLPHLIENENVIYGELLNLDQISQLASSLQVKRTILPDGDSCAATLGYKRKWKGPGRLVLLIMRDPRNMGRRLTLDSAKYKLKSALIRSAETIPLVNVVYLRQRNQANINTADHYATDPTVISVDSSSKESKKEYWSLARDRIWFGICGAITPRKNATLIADALLMLANNNPSIGFAVAGSISAESQVEIQNVVDKLDGKDVAVSIHDKMLTDAELDGFIASVDCVVLAHSNEGPSGILGKAALIGTPVIAAGAHSLREAATAHPESLKWVPLDSCALSNAMLATAPKPEIDFSNKSIVLDFTDPLLID